MVKYRKAVFLQRTILIFFSLILSIIIALACNNIYLSLILIFPFILTIKKITLYSFSNKLKFFDYIFLFLYSILLYFSLFYKTSIYNTFSNMILNFISRLLIISYIFLILIFISSKFLYRPAKEIEKNVCTVRKLNILFYSFPCILSWLFYLFAFYPGIMTSDSIGQWDQMLTGQYNDWHPVIHTIFNKLLTSIWYSPSAIAIAQILILSFIFGYGLYMLEDIGVNKFLLILISILFALSPVNGMLSITLWKDIIFSSLILLYTIIILKILIHKGSCFNNIKFNICYILICLLTMLFRHNGLIAILGVFIFLIFLYKKYFKKILFINLIAILLFLTIKGPIFSLLNIKSTSPTEALAIPLQQIGAVIKYDGYLSTSDIKSINNILPLKIWQNSYNPANVDYIKFNPYFNKNIISNNKYEFLKLWFSIVIKNPALTFKAFINQTSLLWSIKPIYYTNAYALGIYDNDFDLKTTPKSSSLNSTFTKIASTSLESNLIWIFWRPALQLFAIIFVTFLGLRKYGLKVILISLPVLLNTLSVLIAIPAQDFRYLYSTYLVAPIILLFLLFNKKKI